MFDDMKKTVNRNLVKHVAGRAMFCKCSKVLDARTTVVVTHMNEADEPKITVGLCGRCWDKTSEYVMRSFPTTQVVDGRELFAQRKSSRPKRARCRGCSQLYERPTMFRHRAVKGVAYYVRERWREWCEPCYMGPLFDEIRKLDTMGGPK
jgi:hypothetical protein